MWQEQKQQETERRRPGAEVSLRVQLGCAVLMVLVGCVTVTLGFYAPPIGEIHPSVLVAFGEMLTFAGALLGIDYRYKVRR